MWSLKPSSDSESDLKLEKDLKLQLDGSHSFNDEKDEKS